MKFNNNFLKRRTHAGGLAPFLSALLLAALATSASAVEPWPLCRPWHITPPPPLASPGYADGSITLFADAAELTEQQSFDLNGNVLVQRGSEQLVADRAHYDRASGQLQATGNIRFDGPDFTTFSQTVEVNTHSDFSILRGNEYFIPRRHTRGTSETIEIAGRQFTTLKRASLTTCDPGDRGWAIRGSTIKLNHADGIGSVYNARVSFQGVPFLYIPYLRFPITGERTTGLLAPSFGSSSAGGTELALPFYWNIHPQLDATITPHNYTARGLKWDTELRYLSRLGISKLNTELLNDDVYGAKREFYRFEHQGSFANGWRADVRYAKVSDQNYFSDFGNALGTTSVTHLERHAKLTFNRNNIDFMIRAQDYQTLNDAIPESSRPYRRLPQITFDYTPPQGEGWLRYGIESEWVRFQRRDRLMASRLDIQPYVSLPYEGTAGFITPKFSGRYTRYQIDRDSAVLNDYSLSRTLPTFSLDSGIFLERDTEIFSKKMLHTLEPRLFYLYVPYRDQSDLPRFDTGLSGFSMAQLFVENRFNGADRVGDTNQLSLALTSRLLEGDSGKERLRASVGQIVYFDDRRVGLGADQLEQRTNSEVIFETKLALGDYVSVTTDLIWNTEYDLITKRYLKFQYKQGNNKIINISYRYQGNPITLPTRQKREIDLSALWPITPSWSIIGRRYHSLEDNRTLEKMLGVEYDSCCWGFRLVRRALFSKSTSAPNGVGELRYSWLAQLELKGLTSIGKRIEEIMEKSVVGYSSAP